MGPGVLEKHSFGTVLAKQMLLFSCNRLSRAERGNPSITPKCRGAVSLKAQLFINPENKTH